MQCNDFKYRKFIFGVLGLLATVNQVHAEQAAAPLSNSKTATSAQSTAAPLGVTQPVGPPADPFIDASKRGYLMESGWRIIPAINLTYVQDSNPLMLNPSSGTDGIKATNLAVSVESATTGLFSGFFAVGTVRHAALRSQIEQPTVAQLLYTPSIDGWTLPLSYVYSRNKLSRSSLLSQKSDIPPVQEQDTVLNQVTGDAIRQYGDTGVSVGISLMDVQIGVSRLANGLTLASTASNKTHTGRLKITRPAGETSQWFVRGQGDEYLYGSGDQVLQGSKKSNVWTLAAGLQGKLAEQVSFMTELGQARKTSTSDSVPGSESTIGALNFIWAPDVGMNVVAGINRSVFEINVPSLSNAVATSPFLVVSRRLSNDWILQGNATVTRIQVVPTAATLEDRAVNLTLLWKPSRAVLVAASLGRSARSLNSNAAALVNAYDQTKYLVNLTYYP